MTAPVAAWLVRSYKEFKVRMPARMGGLGLSSMVDLIPAAFVGGVQLSNSHCRTLWGRDSSVHSFLVSWVPSCSRPITCDSRCWRVVVQLGKSSQSVGESCSRGGQEACRYLDGGLQGAGEGGDDGSLRRRVVEQTQSLQKAVMEKFLKEYPNPSPRPVLHFPQLDKV